MARQGLTTFKDVVSQMLDFLKTNQEEKAVRDCKRAVLESYREFANAHPWMYLRQHGRINVVAPYSTGTIAYDHEGGVFDRLVTLTSGTWPSWTLYGNLRIGTVDYRIAEVKSSTTLTLDSRLNPGEDVAAGMSYTLYRDSYTLPNDFIAANKFNLENLYGCIEYVSPSTWLHEGRSIYTTSSIPSFFTIFGDDNTYDSLKLAFHPHFDSDQTVDFMYVRRPRDLNIYEHKDGTATVSSGGTTLSGATTNFDAKHIGSVIRLSDSTSLYPGPLWGERPFAQERIIMGVTDANNITVDAAWTQSLAGVKYVVSDPIDIESGAMMNAFLRCCEKNVASQRDMKEFMSRVAYYEMVLKQAKSTDKRYIEPERIGGGGYGRLYGPNVVTNIE